MYHIPKLACVNSFICGCITYDKLFFIGPVRLNNCNLLITRLVTHLIYGYIYIRRKRSHFYGI